jgi:polyhydroxyalkanoate synthesis regulator phasin
MYGMNMLKQMIEYQKTSFDNIYSMMVSFQDQTEKMVNTFIEQSNMVPDEGKKALNEWVNTCKKARDEYKKTIDQSFKQLESYFQETSGSK